MKIPFIEITNFISTDEGHDFYEKVVINATFVVEMFPISTSATYSTRIVTSVGERYYVKETVQEIFDMIGHSAVDFGSK